MSGRKKFLVAALVVFLHYVPQITLWQAESERYTAFWGRANPLRILAGTLLLAAMAVALEAAIRRWGPAWLKRLFQHVFLLALASGLLAACSGLIGERVWLANGLWLAAFVAIIASLAWRRSKLVRYAAVGCLIFSPLMPVLFVQMLTWTTWSESFRSDAFERFLSRQPAKAGTTKPEPAKACTTNPVFLFIFDEWSWLRSTQDGQWLPRLKNIRALSAQAVVYEHALSPGADTMQSLPRLIFQTERQFAVQHGETVFLNHDAATPTREAASLFQSARRQGYATCLLGWFHPYEHMLGDQVDYCRSYFAADEMGWPQQTIDELLENGRNWTDPLSRRCWPPLLDRLDGENAYRMGVRYRIDMLRVLQDCPARSFVVFHVPSPHAPYVFDADGNYYGPAPDWHDTAGYLRQLDYVDGLVGQIVATLRAAAKFDDALLILTSDHGWRFDPDTAVRQLRDWDRRVLLVIKLPGQTTGRVVRETFCTSGLRPLLEAGFGGGP